MGHEQEQAIVLIVGSFQFVKSLQLGDLVWAKDEATGAVALKPIAQTFERVAPATLVLSFSNGETIETTAEHPFYVEHKGFTPAGLVAIGNSIVTRAGPSLQVVAIEKHSSPHRVYNFEVAEFHTYFVGESALWVHNEICDLLGSARSEADAVKAASAAAHEKPPAVACAIELNDGTILKGTSKRQAKNIPDGNGGLRKETTEEFQNRVDPQGRVRQMYNNLGLDASGRGHGHGNCAEYAVIAQIVYSGKIATGAKSVSVLVGGGDHGKPIVACNSCAALFAKLHIEDMHKVAEKLVE